MQQRDAFRFMPPASRGMRLALCSRVAGGVEPLFKAGNQTNKPIKGV